MELTREYFEKYLDQKFDQKLASLATKKDLAQFKELITKEQKDFTERQISEVMKFLVENAVHKDDVRDFSTKEDLKILKHEIIQYIDAKLAEMAVSMSFMETQVAALRKDFHELSKRTKEDDAIFVRELMKLKNRVDGLEKEVKKLRIKEKA